ncbi:MAG: hypothetical protein NXI27_08315 [Alphaproteobacteria bacterium]|nr:hypothetical protein [Alphaproteobacteria bacterium]
MATETASGARVAGPTSDAPGVLVGVGSSVLCAAAVWTVLADTQMARSFSAAAFLVFLLLAQGRFSLRERMLQALALLVTAAAVWRFQVNAVDPVLTDLSRAAYLSSFVMLVTSLRQGAFDSRSVLSIGQFMTSQPPGRRYAALHVGSHFMGVLLNFAAVSLLSPLIKRGVDSKAADAPPALSEIRLRRQINALSRGFAWFNLWAPTAIAHAVVLAIVPGSRAGIIALTGAGIALLLLGVGWVEDRVSGHRARLKFVEAGIDVDRARAPAFPWADMARFLTVTAGLLGLAWLIRIWTGISLVSGIMIAAVPITIMWMVEQQLSCSGSGGGRLVTRVSAIFRSVIPASSPEAATLGLAGYIGLQTAKLVDHSVIADQILLIGPSPDVIYLLVLALVPLASCIGLPPMMTVTFLAGLLVSMPDLQLNPSILGLVFLSGWALNLTGSPFSATSLILSRIVGISGIVHAWKWNGVFTVISWCVTAIVVLLVARWLG